MMELPRLVFRSNDNGYMERVSFQDLRTDDRFVLLEPNGMLVGFYRAASNGHVNAYGINQIDIMPNSDTENIVCEY